MNNKDREDLGILKIEVKNNTKQLEHIITNDLPHLVKEVASNTGKLWVLIPLVIGTLLAVAGIYLVLFLM